MEKRDCFLKRGGALPEGVEGEETLLVHRHSSGALE